MPSEVQIFSPLITNSPVSSSNTARVRSDARSLPEPGSEKPWHHTSVPAWMPRRWACCAGVPYRISVGATLLTPSPRTTARTRYWASTRSDDVQATAAELGRPVRGDPADGAQRALPVEAGGERVVVAPLTPVLGKQAGDLSGQFGRRGARRRRDNGRGLPAAGGAERL